MKYTIEFNLPEDEYLHAKHQDALQANDALHKKINSLKELCSEAFDAARSQLKHGEPENDREVLEKIKSILWNEVYGDD